MGRCYRGGSLLFDAQPFLVTDADPDGIMASFPTTFHMDGTVLAYSSAARTGPPLLSVSVFGQGSMTTGPMRRFDEGATAVIFTATSANRIVTFEPAVSPTPEPATLLLLAPAWPASPGAAFECRSGLHYVGRVFRPGALAAFDVPVTKLRFT